MTASTTPPVFDRKNGGTGWGGAYADAGNSTVVDAVGLTYGVLGLPDWRIHDLGANQSTNAHVGITPDVVDLLAVRIAWGVADAGLAGTGTSAIYLYVNPALGGTPTPTTGRNITMTNFDKIRLAGQNGIVYSFDEIRIGETFVDVTPRVPEPSSLVLAGGALAFLGSLRCRHYR